MRSGELCRAVGLTRRELDYWRRQGILTTSERTAGGHYRFQACDLVRARWAVRLRRSGLSLRQTARALEALAPELDLLVGRSELADCATWHTSTR